MDAIAEAKALYEQAEDVIEGMFISVDEPYWNSSVAAAQSETYLAALRTCHSRMVTCPKRSQFWNAFEDELSLGLSKIERRSQHRNQNRQPRWKAMLLVSKLD